MKGLLLALALGSAGIARAGPERARAGEVSSSGAVLDRGRGPSASPGTEASQKSAAPQSRPEAPTAPVQGSARSGTQEKGAAVSAPARPSARHPKIAVLDIRSTGNLDVKEVSGLTGLIAAEAGRFELQVLAGADLSALVGFEKQRQLLGCAEGACLAEIGGALGVAYLLSAEVSRVGNVWLLNMALLEVASARAVQRIVRKAPDMTGIVTEATEATQALVAAIAQRKAAPGDKIVEASARAEPVPGLAAQAQERPKGARSQRRILAYSVGGAGVAALGGGVAFGLAAKSSYDKALQTSQGADPSRSEVLSLRNQTTRQMWIADGLYAAGAVALGVGLYLAFTGENGPERSSVILAPLPGGAALAIARGF